MLAFALLTRQHPTLFRTFLGAAGAILVWSALLYLPARRANRTLALEIVVRRQHWLQACAQGTVLLYWGWHARIVYPFLPFILAQVIFAYAVDCLLSWSRRNAYTLGFGPFPIIFSINLFLWFRLEWFYWQFAMIALGFVAKEFIRWNREGRQAHIFNPSSFPLAVFSLALLVTGTSNLTLGYAIANTQFDTPLIYLAIFLVALPGQLSFGVARMTLSAVVTTYLISLLYFQMTGTYLFYDVHIPVPVFLGMHLLFTDPSTSPRTELGRIIFGMLYALGTTALFVLLSALGTPTFYDKLLPVPLMNLMVRGIDRLARTKPLAALDPAGIGRALSPSQRNVAYTSVWAGVFVALSAVHGVGDKHPGQYLPFWQDACVAGSTRACNYAANLLAIYCNNGSGWACNEVGLLQRELNQPSGADFQRACDLGFSPGCENLNRAATGVGPLQRAGPRLPDLPIVLRGTKPPLRERDPAKLLALACEQGWVGMCDGRPGVRRP
jgi:Na+-translocating ferredoxin:NAD+ oxidoreductase RnfD subunit